MQDLWEISDEYDFDIQVYLKGAFDARVLKNGKIVKKFFGETAHMDANRFAYDICTQERYGK